MTDMLGLSSRAETVEEVALLADRYAERVVESWDPTLPLEMLQAGIAGSFLSFLTEALLLANSRRAV